MSCLYVIFSKLKFSSYTPVFGILFNFGVDVYNIIHKKQFNANIQNSLSITVDGFIYTFLYNIFQHTYK